MFLVLDILDVPGRFRVAGVPGTFRIADVGDTFSISSVYRSFTIKDVWLISVVTGAVTSFGPDLGLVLSPGTKLRRVEIGHRTSRFASHPAARNKSAMPSSALGICPAYSHKSGRPGACV
jgi:hypothetical protein